ncbi:UNVERIFIED_CONTAM: hypothetical protein RMT77_002040 [Armadillidium vulgare]
MYTWVILITLAILKNSINSETNLTSTNLRKQIFNEDQTGSSQLLGRFKRRSLVRRSREGRFLPFKSLFSFSKVEELYPKVTSISEIVAKNENAITLRIMCETLGGTLVEDECLEFVGDNPSNFIEARNICREKGGDLFVPQQYEGFFFPKFFLYFPQAFKENSRSLGWVGALRGGAGAPVLTIDGKDVTTDAIYNINTITGSQCLNIYINKGSAFLRGEDCAATLSFTCEYVFDEEATKMVKEKNFVTKALTYSNKKYARIFNNFPYSILNRK